VSQHYSVSAVLTRQRAVAVDAKSTRLLQRRSLPLRHPSSDEPEIAVSGSRQQRDLTASAALRYRRPGADDRFARRRINGDYRFDDLQPLAAQLSQSHALSVSPSCGGRLHCPDDPRAERREPDVRHRAAAFVGHRAAGSPHDCDRQLRSFSSSAATGASPAGTRRRHLLYRVVQRYVSPVNTIRAKKNPAFAGLS
jgi:hypothetical protein